MVKHARLFAKLKQQLQTFSCSPDKMRPSENGKNKNNCQPNWRVISHVAFKGSPAIRQRSSQAHTQRSYELWVHPLLCSPPCHCYRQYSDQLLSQMDTTRQGVFLSTGVNLVRLPCVSLGDTSRITRLKYKTNKSTPDTQNTKYCWWRGCSLKPVPSL